MDDRRSRSPMEDRPPPPRRSPRDDAAYASPGDEHDASPARGSPPRDSPPRDISPRDSPLREQHDN